MIFGWAESRRAKNRTSLGWRNLLPRDQSWQRSPTRKELNVGDIAQIEPNIHAGVKYMRFMIDQHYEKEPMTKVDKALFAFASYNAGPARVQQLRNEAAKRGLNPNVWFSSVEYIAAEKLGQETVTYVSDIYKYNVGYRLLLESRARRDEAVKKLGAPAR